MTLVNFIDGSAGRDEGPTWLERGAIVQLIRARADEPWVSLELGQAEIAHIRAGGIVTLAGPSGGGKTSLALAFMLPFAREQGWVFVLSRELTGDEAGGRAIAMATDSSWEDVLRGRLNDEQMLAALPERMRMLDRKAATLDALDDELERFRAKQPDGPVLFVVDYGQIIGEATEDQRARVTAAWEYADDIARRHRAVGLVLSQMSRAASRAARGGERLGADALDGGAESAAIERYSTVVLEIGAAGPEDEYGRREVQLSTGKGRMGGGDKVIPMSYEGRSGRWAVIGEAKPASEVRAEAKAKHNDSRLNAACLATEAAAARATEPVSREEMRAAAAVSRDMSRAAITQLLDEGRLVEVRRKRPRASAWLLWTPERARESGVPLVTEVPK